MFAVLSRFDPRVEEAARDLGASNLQSLRYVVIPILLPGIHRGGAVRLHPLLRRVPAQHLHRRRAQHAAARNLEHDSTNVTSPALYALGTVTTAISFFIIVISLTAIGVIQARRQRARKRAGP